MVLYRVGMIILLLVLDARLSTTVVKYAEERKSGDDPQFSCLGNFEFPKGTQERIFKVVRCSPTHPIKADCSQELMLKIANFSEMYPKEKFDDLPEDLGHLLTGITQMWWIVFRELHNKPNCGSSTDDALCWDFYPMLKTVLEIDLLNSYLIWIPPYAIPFIIVEVMFGILANALLITVVLKFKEMRTEPNMIILNIAVSDTLLLMNFTVLSCVMYLMPVTMVLRGFCRGLLSFSTFNSSCSVYSVVALSFLRHMAISAVPGGTLDSQKKYFKIPVMITLVWLVSSLASVPYILDISENCLPNFVQLFQTLGFLSFCVLPLILLITFNIASRRKLKKMPDHQNQKMDCEIWARERGDKIILTLSTVHVISLVLPTIAIFTSVFTEVKSGDYFRAVVRQMIFYLNACINPVAIILSSEAFRKHLKLMLPSCVIGNKFAPSEEE